MLGGAGAIAAPEGPEAPGLWPEGGAIGIIFAVGAWECASACVWLDRARKSGWIRESTSDLGPRIREASREAIDSSSYPFDGRGGAGCIGAFLWSRDEGEDKDPAAS